MKKIITPLLIGSTVALLASCANEKQQNSMKIATPRKLVYYRVSYSKYRGNWGRPKMQIREQSAPRFSRDAMTTQRTFSMIFVRIAAK